MAAVRPTLLLLQGLVALEQLIACINVAAFMVAHGARRASEFAVRTAVAGGAGAPAAPTADGEPVVAALGGLGGLLLAGWALDLTVGLMPVDVLRAAQIAVNGRLLAFAADLVVVTALAFGSAPAVHVLRQGSHGVLRERRPVGSGARLRRGLVAAEVALALVLLVGAGLLVQSLARLVNVDLGFNPANTAALQVFRYPDGSNPVTDAGLADTANFFRQTLRDIRALPGVAGAAAVSSLPLVLADVTRESPSTLRPAQPRARHPEEGRSAHADAAARRGGGARRGPRRVGPGRCEPGVRVHGAHDRPAG